MTRLAGPKPDAEHWVRRRLICAGDRIIAVDALVALKPQ